MTTLLIINGICLIIIFPKTSLKILIRFLTSPQNKTKEVQQYSTGHHTIQKKLTAWHD